jgi:hypothetical protein
MGIGRRYFTVAAILFCAFICSSHYTEYPTRGWKPHDGWGSREKHRREEQARAEADKKEGAKQRKARERREERELEKARINADRAEQEGIKAQKLREKVERAKEHIARRAENERTATRGSSDGGKATFVPRDRGSGADSNKGRSGSKSSRGGDGRRVSAADKYFDQTTPIRPTQRWR